MIRNKFLGESYATMRFSLLQTATKVLALFLLGDLASAFWSVPHFRSHAPIARSALFQASLRYKDVNHMIDTLQTEGKIVVMMFTSDNCGPCRLQKKELKRLWSKKKHHDESLPLKIVTIDMEKWPQVGRRFHIGKLPCLLVFEGARDAARLEGLVSAEELWNHISNFTV